MRMPGKIMTLAALGALTVMAAITPSASAFAAAGHSYPQARGPASAPAVPRPTTGAPAFRAPSDSQSCRYVRAHFRELARAGVHAVGCLRLRRPYTKSIARPGAGSRVLHADSLSDCSGAPGGEWILVDRTDECMQQSLGYVVYDPSNGQPLAGATVSTDEEFSTSTVNPDWDEDVSVSMSNPWGNTGYLVDIEVTWMSLCTYPCSPQESSAFGGGWVYLSPGQTVDGELVLDSTIPVDGQVTMTQGDWLIVYNPATINPYTSASWNAEFPVRCDDQIGGDYGCVFPAYEPNLVLPESQYGGAAAFILWAQVNQGGYGLPYGAGPPLTRLADQNQAQQNRDTICDSTWVPDPNFPTTDSCDEFPFAATYQSGAMNGYTGSQCAEVEPYFDGSSWQVADLNGIVNSGCTRAHTDLNQNTAVGGALGNFYLANRVLDDDPFTVQVTTG